MSENLVSLIKKSLQPLKDEKSDYDSLMQMAKDKRFVLIGESTHGTKEFYKIRAEITKRLIEELDFNAVAIEGDWPDAYHVNRYVNNMNHEDDAKKVLENFERFPIWMWQNKEVLEFIKWLHAYNLTTSAAVRFYGLDLYAMSRSIAAIIDYLGKIDPKESALARERYSCLEDYGNISNYRSLNKNCEENIVMQLIELRKKSFEYLKKDGFFAQEEFFCATQNAALVKDAQQYYRSLYYGEPISWNLRDSHMAKTLGELAIYLTKANKKPAKIVVWAHNSHIGDARATQMSERGELNIGQLMREEYGDKTLLIGFLTYNGTVSAASNWDMPVERKKIIPALNKSIEYLFHQTEVKKFILNFKQNKELSANLNAPLIQRFIGVIYRPQSEYLSHYYPAKISEQFDAVIYVDKTSALEPLKTTSHWHKDELDETYPFGL